MESSEIVPEESYCSYKLFKQSVVKETIDDVLFDYLSTKVYNAEKAQRWTEEIAVRVRNKMKDLGYEKYKFSVNVILIHRKDAKVKVGTRCLWQKEYDTYVYCNFTNNTIACTAIVYAAYCNRSRGIARGLCVKEQDR